MAHLQYSTRSAQFEVLLIDDEEALLNLNEEILTPRYKVFKATNLQVARQILQSEKIQIILCDHYLENESGLSFLIEINAQAGIIKMLLTSCTSHQIMQMSHNTSGIFRYLIKPCLADDLLGNMNTAVGEWHKVQHNVHVHEKHEESVGIVQQQSSRVWRFLELNRKIKEVSLNCVDGVVRLGIAALICGVIVILSLYILKSLAGFDIFR